jgi:adenine-specific DNA methylase
MFLELATNYNNAVFDNKKNNRSSQGDAIEFVKRLENVDLIYFDPPYCNSHADYQSFYHLLETFVENWTDKKFVNGVKRYDPKLYSGFDIKKDISLSFEKLFKESEKIPYWIISYNDRSYPHNNQMIEMISKYKHVEVKKKTYSNCVGGKGSVKGSNELLFICSPKH